METEAHIKVAMKYRKGKNRKGRFEGLIWKKACTKCVLHFSNLEHTTKTCIKFRVCTIYACMLLYLDFELM